MLSMKVDAEGKTYTNVNKLRIYRVKAFEELDREYIKNLCHSMPRKLITVIKIRRITKC